MGTDPGWFSVVLVVLGRPRETACAHRSLRSPVYCAEWLSSWTRRSAEWWMIRFSEAGVCATDYRTEQHLPQSSPLYQRHQHQTRTAADRSSAETERETVNECNLVAGFNLSCDALPHIRDYQLCLIRQNNMYWNILNRVFWFFCWFVFYPKCILPSQYRSHMRC